MGLHSKSVTHFRSLITDNPIGQKTKIADHATPFLWDVLDESFDQLKLGDVLRFILSRVVCTAQLIQDTFLKEFSYSIGDISSFDE